MCDNFSGERWVHPPTCRIEVGALLRPSSPWWCSGQERAENVENVVAGALRRAWACGLRVRFMFQAFWGSWVDVPQTAFSLHPLLSQKWVGAPTIVHCSSEFPQAPFFPRG